MDRRQLQVYENFLNSMPPRAARRQRAIAAHHAARWDAKLAKVAKAKQKLDEQNAGRTRGLRHAILNRQAEKKVSRIMDPKRR